MHEIRGGSCEIYYFSGTGNSLAVAKDIADRTDGRMIPIASLAAHPAVETDAEAVGLVFPVYYGDLPVIVREFALKLHCAPGTYVFAVCTYGGAAMASLRSLRKIFRRRGKRLSAAFGVHMPQNAFFKPKEDRQRLYAAWKKRLEFIASKINSRETGVFYENRALELLILPMQPLVIRSACLREFSKQTKLPPGTSYSDLVRGMDSGFTVNDACTGCGTCAHICPVGNIRLDGKKPVWQHRCENCLACYNWCPNKAISGGLASKGYFYRHSGIKPKATQKDGFSAIMRYLLIFLR